ncbi:FeoB-associated Cys-rich membrane protein [Echinicola pacifica]
MWQEIIVWSLFIAVIGWKTYSYFNQKKSQSGCGCTKCDSMSPKSSSANS